MKNKFNSLAGLPEMQKAMISAAKLTVSGEALPPMLVIFPLSVEPDLLMDDFCDELDELGLVKFTGDKRWLDIIIDRPEDNGFNSFLRMLTVLQNEAGYRNQFGGVVRLDLTSWLKYTEDDRLSSLFAFMYDYSPEIFFIITVSSGDMCLIDMLRSRLARWMYVTTVKVGLPSGSILMNSLEERLKKLGYIMADDALELIEESVEYLAANEDFEGFREIESFATAIAFAAPNSEIRAEDLEDFTVNGYWVRQRSKKIGNTIGFTGGYIYGK